jgi:hypothetical protein
MSPAMQNLDAIPFEILSHRLHEITKEMGTALGGRDSATTGGRPSSEGKFPKDR